MTIDPLPISLLSVSSISKTYDGSADVTLTADKLTFFSKTANIKLPDTALSFSDAQFTSKQEDGSYLPSPEVGNGKALSFTMTLTSNNYVFEGKSEGTTKVSDVFATDDVNRFTITKAAAPTVQPVELTVINGLAKTYLVNLPALPTLGDNCKYGSIKYEACNFDLIGEGGYANSTAMITSNDEFQLTVPAVESQAEGSVGTVGVKITTDNYQDMLLTVEVIAKNKIVPVLDGEITATPITYGDTLSDSSITGKMKDPNTGDEVNGTFTWTDGTIKPDANDRYEAEWTFTPDSEEYATVTDTATVEVAPKSIEGAVITLESADLEYNAAEQSPRITGVTLEDWSETRITYDIKSGDKATDANDSIPLTIEGTGNYTGTAMVEWKITPKTVTPTIEVEPCTYTGDALEPAVTLKDGDAVIPAGEYTAEQAYQAFNAQLLADEPAADAAVLTLDKGYSNVFHADSGNASFSVMANTLRGVYDTDVLIAAANSFTGSVLQADYTKATVRAMIMPNGLLSYQRTMTGAELKDTLRTFVEGCEGGFTPFNRGSLPVVSGIAVQVEENGGSYKLTGVTRNGQPLQDDDTVTVTCLATENQMTPLLQDETRAFERGADTVKNLWGKALSDGSVVLAAPESYITLG